MAEVTRQYLSYVDQIRNQNLELAGEYLLMAALLIEIKSRMLLPVKKSDTGEEVDDPRAELVRRLLEYEQMKLAALQRSEEHTSELQSLMRISYAVFCLKKNNRHTKTNNKYVRSDHSHTSTLKHTPPLEIYQTRHTTS